MANRAMIYLSDEALRTDSFPEENGLFRQITHEPIGVVYVIVSLHGLLSVAPREAHGPVAHVNGRRRGTTRS